MEEITSFEEKGSPPCFLSFTFRRAPTKKKRIKPNTVAALLDHNSQGTLEPSTTIGIEHFGIHPILLVRPVTLPVGTEPTIWKPPLLLQIVSHPTPDLVKRLTTSCVPYVSYLACQTFRK